MIYKIVKHEITIVKTNDKNYRNKLQQKIITNYVK